MTRKPHDRGRFDDILEGGGGGRGGGGYGSPRNWRDLFKPSTRPQTPATNRAAERIRNLNRQGADDLHETLVYRAYGRRSPKESNPQLREAADDIEKFLGGKIKPEDIKPSKAKDLVILKGDKKFRMDVKNPGKKKDRKTKDDPHFHFERIDEKGDWIDATDGHKNYFKKD